MTLHREKCDSCNLLKTDTKVIKLGMNISVCRQCYHWVRSSIARTRKIPNWIRPDSEFSHEKLGTLRRKYATQTRQHRQINHAIHRHYSGPLNDGAWGVTLSNLQLTEFNYPNPLPNIDIETVDRKLAELNRAGILYIPQNPNIREHITHFLQGTFGPDNTRLFVTILFLWLTSEDDYVARDPNAWAKSFQLLFEVIEDLADRAYFVHGAIEVVGSSGHTYRIQPKSGRPYFHVAGQVGEQYQHICIDPVGARNVIFGDVLVTLILSLYDDQTSARHIDTLARYLFGGNRGRRITDVQQLWRRALGNMPRQLRGNRQDRNSAISTTMEYIIDRFQTNLADWSDEGGEA